MRNMLKKSLAVLLSLLCLANIAAFTVSAATVSSGKCGDNIMWKLDGSGHLIISGKGDMWEKGQFTEVWDDAIVKKITVKNGVTSICDNAFSYTDNLKEVNFPDSLNFVGRDVFYSSEYKMKTDSYGVQYEDNVLIFAPELTGTYKIKDGTRVIADGAFTLSNSEQKVKEVIFPTSLVTIGNFAFGHAFANGGVVTSAYPCQSLVKADLSNNKNLKYIGYNAFKDCVALTSMIIPENVTYVGESAFENCKALKNVTIGNSVKSIGSSAFCDCENLKEIVIPHSVTEIGEAAFFGCQSLQKVSIRGRITDLKLNTFDYCDNLKVLELPSTLKIVYRRVVDSGSLKDVYYEGTEAQWNQIEMKIDNDGLVNATKHYNHKFPQPSTTPGNPSTETETNNSNSSETSTETTTVTATESAPPPVQNGYNRGEETYKFQNYVDFHFEGFNFEFGHCFGMAVTSSGYYINMINIRERIGISDSSRLYAEAEDDHKFIKVRTATHTAPICYYQNRQGSNFKNAIVAGGSWWLTKATEKLDLSGDWDSVVAYVQDGGHNDKGDLILVYAGDISGQHSVNFLKCEGEGDNAKIYVYDNNFPEDDNIYLYKENGKVYCNFSSSDPENIKSLTLFDVAKYLENVDGFKVSNVVYAEKGDIEVTYTIDGETEVTEEFPLIGCKDEVVAHEIEDKAEHIEIKPLKKDAQFVYMGNTYTVEEGDSFKVNLAEKDEDASEIKLEGAKKALTMKENAKKTLTPSVYITENYTISYVSSDVNVISVDEKGTATATGTGTATVTCTVKDENGKVIAEELYEITVTESSVNWTVVIVLAIVVLITAAGIIAVVIIKKRKKLGQ